MNRDEARKKAQELVSRMTLEEKASQLRYDAPAIKRLGIPAYNWWNEGLHGVARAGQATVFPQAIGMAATFDRDCVAEMADIVATEVPVPPAAVNRTVPNGRHSCSPSAMI